MATLAALLETCAATTEPSRPADLLGERRESWVVMTTLTASTQQSHHPVGPGDSWSLLNVTLPLDNFEIPGCLRHVESEDRSG